MDNNKPNTISNIPTNNRYGILADCHILDDQEPQKITETPNKQHTATNDTTTKLLPIYIHGKNNHVKLLEKLKANYPNAYTPHQIHVGQIEDNVPENSTFQRF